MGRGEGGERRRGEERGGELTFSVDSSSILANTSKLNNFFEFSCTKPDNFSAVIPYAYVITSECFVIKERGGKRGMEDQKKREGGGEEVEEVITLAHTCSTYGKLDGSFLDSLIDESAISKGSQTGIYYK